MTSNPTQTIHGLGPVATPAGAPTAGDNDISALHNLERAPLVATFANEVEASDDVVKMSLQAAMEDAVAEFNGKT